MEGVVRLNGLIFVLKKPLIWCLVI